jgi:hypothetical protein
MAKIIEAIKKKKVSIDLNDKKKWPRFTPDDRLKLYRKCGQPCFAKPIRDKPKAILANPQKTLKFPICRVPTPKSKKCKISAAGLLAANRRATLTKKYPEIRKETSKLIKKLGTTQKARKEIKIKLVRVNEKPLPNGKHIMTITYIDGVKKDVPYTKGHILRKYGKFLSKAQHKRLSTKPSPSQSKSGLKKTKK